MSNRATSKIIELQKRVEVLTEQRDQAVSKLLAAQLKIIELNNKVERLTE